MTPGGVCDCGVDRASVESRGQARSTMRLVAMQHHQAEPIGAITRLSRTIFPEGVR